MTTWTRPARCSFGDCVEVAFDGINIHIRDSKHPNGAVLTFTKPEFTAFIDATKRGEFDVDST